MLLVSIFVAAPTSTGRLCRKISKRFFRFYDFCNHTNQKGLLFMCQLHSSSVLLSSTPKDRKEKRTFTSGTVTQNNNQNESLPRVIISSHHRTNLIFGANTDVGKTIISTGLIRAAEEAALNNSKNSVHYIKPVQCGSGETGGDKGFLEKYVGNNVSTTVSVHNLFYLDRFSSPHLASLGTDWGLSDHDLVNAIRTKLCDIHNNPRFHKTVTYIETAGGVLSPSTSSPYNKLPHHAKLYHNDQQWGWTTQGDLYQTITKNYHVPVIFIGDGRLGGISATLSSLESLIIRGYDIAALILLETEESVTAGYGNIDAIRSYLSNSVLPIRVGTGERLFNKEDHPAIISLPPIPADPSVPLNEWYDTNHLTFTKINAYLQNTWEGYISDLKNTVLQNTTNIPNKSFDWTSENKNSNSDIDRQKQHSIMMFDSVVSNNTHNYLLAEKLSSQNDGDSNDVPTKIAQVSFLNASGSGVENYNGTTMNDTSTTLAVAAATGRYGSDGGTSSDCYPLTPCGDDDDGDYDRYTDHFSSILSNKNSSAALHIPVITLNEKLIESSNGPGHGWASRVLYLDGINDAIGNHTTFADVRQLGFCIYEHRMSAIHGDDALQAFDLVVCGQDSGDNDHHHREGDDGEQDLTVDLLLEPPTLGFYDGKLKISFQEGLNPPESEILFEFDSTEECMDVMSRNIRNPKLKSLYKEMIEMQYLVYEHKSVYCKIASIIIEPICMSSNMQFIDPLWQQALVEVGRSRKVPIIYDETFTGLYRLGVVSSGEILRKNPDIAIIGNRSILGHFSAILTNEDTYDANLWQKELCDNKSYESGKSPLLYIPSPSSCVAAIHNLEAAYSWSCSEFAGVGSSISNTRKAKSSDRLRKFSPRIIMMFDEEKVKAISRLPLVKHSFTLGTVLSVTIEEDEVDEARNNHGEEGWNHRNNCVTRTLFQRLKSHGIQMRVARGNVISLIVSPLSSKDECARVLDVMYQTIDRVGQEGHQRNR